MPSSVQKLVVPSGRTPALPESELILKVQPRVEAPKPIVDPEVTMKVVSRAGLERERKSWVEELR